MVTKQEAIKYLSNAQQDRLFWVHDGHCVSNLEGLAGELHSMNDSTFKYHMNKEKKDFSNWINEVIGDKKLGSEFLKAKNRVSAFKKVHARVAVLKKKAK